VRTDPLDVRERPDGFAGEAIGPADAAYETARRVFNAGVDRRPALIARCTSAADVTAAVLDARQHGLPLSVRSTGHSLAGHCLNDGGVVIDLNAMKRVEIDPLRRRARVEAGVTWEELDQEAQRLGLAVTGARTSTTGVVGVTLGGGSGWLERKLGLSADNLLGAELVSADGELLRASRREHPELFWALRGGGGNFGVVSWIDLALHPLDSPMLGGQLVYPRDRASELLTLLREFMAHAPEALGIGAAMTATPNAPFVPEPVRNRPIIGLTVCYAGEPEAGKELLRPLRDELSPLVDTIAPLLYPEVQRILDRMVPPGRRYAAKAEQLERLSDDAIEVLVDHANSAPSPGCEVVFLPGGGALDRISSDAGPLADRRAAGTVQVLAAWDQPAEGERHVAWARAGSIALEPFSSGACLNLTGRESAERIRGAFTPGSYARLQAVKASYDPQNIFRSNHNIPPEAST
jgi:FAD/FMN-containing dehydrogenase